MDNLWYMLAPLGLGFLAIYWLLPRAEVFPRLGGAVAAAGALLSGGYFLMRWEGLHAETILFYVFSAVAVLAGGLLLTQSNPVHAALSFALVVLSTCGLFLLQAAPFLMAATIIVYAGAIVVTFLFVIMLAQQSGMSDADHRSREPFLATLAGFVLLGCLLYLLNRTYPPGVSGCFQLIRQDQVELDKLVHGEKAKSKEAKVTLRILDDHLAMFDAELQKSNGPPESSRLRDQIVNVRDLLGRTEPDLTALSRRLSELTAVTPLPAANVAGLGQTLFSEFLLPVELGGTLLLVAAIGAIAIAGRGKEALR